MQNVLANFVEHAANTGKPIGEIVKGEDVARGGTEYRFTFSDGTKAVADGAMKLAGNHADIILFKRGGELMAIKFDKGSKGLGLAVAKAASGENMGRWGDGLERIPRFTHWMSAMRTQYSPEFTISNLLADHLEVYQTLVGRYGVKGGTQAFGRMVASEIANAKALREYIKTGSLSGDVGDAIRAGLLTKGGVSSEGFEGKEQSIRNRIAEFGRKAKKFRDMTPMDWAKSTWTTVRDFVSDLNEFSEYSTRIGIFSALRKQGVSVADAVKFARDATVNFNRKGTMTPYLNGLYMFANASIQGTVRSLEAMGDRHGGQLIAMLTTVGVAKAMIDHFLGNDDDRERAGGRNARNMSEYDRKHNVGIPIGGGMQVVPFRFRGPYAAIPYLAQTAANVFLGETTPAEGAKYLVRELGDQVSDIVGGNGFLDDNGHLSGALAGQTLAPSLMDPFVQLASGKDYKGDDLRRRSFDDTTPASSNGKRNTSALYKGVAEGLNWLTGGNSLRKGAFDFAPEDYQLFAEFLGGGPLRDVGNLASTFGNIRQAMGGETPDNTWSQVPVVRRIVREYPESTSRYYEALERYEADKAEYKKTVGMKERAELRRNKPYLSATKSHVDYLSERIDELLHAERGEVKKGRRWVERKIPPAPERKEELRRRRLKLQAKVLAIINPRG